jgi:hypothetical protein
MAIVGAYPAERVTRGVRPLWVDPCPWQSQLTRWERPPGGAELIGRSRLLSVGPAYVTNHVTPDEYPGPDLQSQGGP